MCVIDGIFLSFELSSTMTVVLQSELTNAKRSDQIVFICVFIYFIISMTTQIWYFGSLIKQAVES